MVYRKQSRRRLPADPLRDVVMGAAYHGGRAAYHAGRAGVRAFKRQADRNRSHERQHKRAKVGMRRDAGGRSEQMSMAKFSATWKSDPMIKLFNSSLNSVIQRFSGVNVVNPASNTIAPGNFKLENYTDAVPETYAPVHLLDITSMLNGSSIGAVGPMTGIKFNSAGVPLLYGKAGFDSTGASNGNWQYERCDRNPAVNSGYTHAIHTGCQVKMLAYGCSAQPTNYTIEVVQFLNDELVLEGAGTLLSPTSTAWWQAYCKPYMYNPCMTVNPSTRKHYKVLKKFDFQVDPSLTTDQDLQPNSKLIEFYLKFNQVRDFSYFDASENNGNKLNTDTFSVNIAGLRYTPRPTERVYIIIRAMNTTPTAVASESQANTPSYDLVLRNYWKYAI